MPRKTDGEKIDELEKLAAVLTERVERAQQDITDLYAAQKGRQEFERLQDREIALLKRELEEQRKWAEKNGVGELKAELALFREKVAKLEAAQDRAGNRAWSVVPNIIGALVSSALAGLIAYLVARR